MAPWTEIGAALLVAGALLGAAEQPSPWIHIADAPEHEGRRVSLTGWTQEIREGDGWARFVLVQEGHALHVFAHHAPAPGLVAVTGTLDRVDGQLVLRAEPEPWTSSSR